MHKVDMLETKSALKTKFTTFFNKKCDFFAIKTAKLTMKIFRMLKILRNHNF